MSDLVFLFFSIIVRFARWDQPLQHRFGKYGDVTDRIVLKDRLKCQSFKWYLDNIAVATPQHHLLGTGTVKY